MLERKQSKEGIAKLKKPIEICGANILKKKKACP